MIDVRIVKKAFGSNEILKDVFFEVEKGETLAILGPSGIGKSTLLRLIAGIDKRFDGVIKRPEKMAMVFQEPTLMPWRSVLENVTLVHLGLDQNIAEAILKRVGLGGKEAMFPGQLSLGQQRRLTLARAFVGRPELLIMDEPFVSLDKERVDEMLSLAEELIGEVKPATLFVTHARPEADRLATRIMELRGTPATLVSV